MFRMNIRAAALATTIAVLLVAPGVTWAQASKAPVAGTITMVAVVDPGTQFFDEDGILHIRGQVNENAFQGDLVGVQFVTFDVNVDPVTGEGDIHGSADFTGTALGRTGTFEGRFDGPIVGGLIFFSATLAQGSGEFDGMKLMLTGQTIMPMVLSYTGRILDPHGGL